ncbi:MAG: hypothetical protein ABI852_05115 [Gemmatimonadaceae bacterium]
MEMFAFAVSGLLQLILPIVGYILAMRAGRSRGQILAASAMGGALAGFMLAIPLIRVGAGFAGLPYVFMSTLIGAGIGLAGLLARALGTWLNRRP